MSDEPRPYRIQVSVLDNWTLPPGITTAIEQAWLPVVLLDGVKLAVQSSQNIGTMQRFAIEALLQLQTLEAGELQEIASIPSELGLWLLESLRHKGLACKVDSRFAPDVQRCTAVLESGQLPIETEEKRDVLWCPETDEVVLLKSAAAQFRRLRVSASWPMPAGWQGKTRAALLTEPLQEKRCYGEGSGDIVRALDDRVVTATCFPAYRCAALLSSSAQVQSWHLELLGSARKKRDDDATPEVISVPVDMPLLPGLVGKWRRRMQHARAAVETELDREYGITVEPSDPEGFSVCLRESEARAFARDRLVCEAHGVRVRVDDELQYLVPLRCSPADEGAAKFFAVDAAIRRLLSGERSGSFGVSVCDENVFTRLWELRLFKPLYDLREPVDFAA